MEGLVSGTGTHERDTQARAYSLEPSEMNRELVEAGEG